MIPLALSCMDSGRSGESEEWNRQSFASEELLRKEKILTNRVMLELRQKDDRVIVLVVETLDCGAEATGNSDGHSEMNMTVEHVFGISKHNIIKYSLSSTFPRRIAPSHSPRDLLWHLLAMLTVDTIICLLRHLGPLDSDEDPGAGATVVLLHVISSEAQEPRHAHEEAVLRVLRQKAL